MIPVLGACTGISDSAIKVKGEIHASADQNLNDCQLELYVKGVDRRVRFRTLSEASINESFTTSPNGDELFLQIVCNGDLQFKSELYDTNKQNYYETPIDLGVIELSKKDK